MGLSPTEKNKVLSAVNDLRDLEKRVDAIEVIINSFEDVQKAIRKADMERKKEEKAEKDRLAKLEETERKNMALKAAEKADTELKKAIKKAEEAQIAAGLIKPDKE
uniref:Uncharacterized protein n=1 Tax=viral metagenome TaxID=1070528 RepID=A0A6H1ZL08_9ZZZZ